MIESLGPGGAERLLIATLSHLDSRFQNHVIYLFGRHDLVPDIPPGVSVTCLEMKSFFDVRGLLRLRSFLRDIAPDIVHTVLQRSDVIGRIAAATAGLRPIVSTLHECPYNPEVFIDNSGLSRVQYGVFKLIDQGTARLFNDGFFVVSYATRKNLQKFFGVNHDIIRVLYSGIDLDEIDRIDDRHEHIRAQLGIRPDQRVLLNVARLFQQKGQRHLIQAMRLVVDKIPNVRLLIRGDGPDREGLQALAARLGLAAHVTLLDGYRSHSDVLALIRLCDVFVFPSLYEGLGIALIEALALRRPCVASNVGPIPEVIDHGRTGLLVPSMDSQALSNAVVTLLRDPARRLRMGREGRKVVEERFDILRNVRLLEQGYLDLLAGRWAQPCSTGW